MKLASPVGQWLSDRSGKFKGTIVGVVKDYHFTPLRQKIEPLVLIYYPPDCRLVVARLEPGDIPTPSANQGLEKSRSRFPLPLQFPRRGPGRTLSVGGANRDDHPVLCLSGHPRFLPWPFRPGLIHGRAEDEGDRHPESPGRLGSDDRPALLEGILEMGPAANLIAWPAAYYAVSKWLEGYPYRVSVGAGPFLLAGALAFVVAALTVGYHSVRAARANPVESLRHE
jgi:putative ABC transport system permease protein